MKDWSRMRVCWLFLALWAAAGNLAAQPSPAYARPDAVVRGASEALLGWAARKAPLTREQGQDLLAMVQNDIAPHFDFETMTRLAVGKHWRLANPAQRAALVAEFRQLLIRIYTMAYMANSEVRVVIEPLKLTPGATECTVHSQLILPGSRPPVTVDYDMRRTDTGWKIYNVAVDSVSLVTTYRQDFSERIRRGGIDSLIASLKERNSSSVQ